MFGVFLIVIFPSFRSTLVYPERLKQEMLIFIDNFSICFFLVPTSSLSPTDLFGLQCAPSHVGSEDVFCLEVNTKGVLFPYIQSL